MLFLSDQFNLFGNHLSDSVGHLFDPTSNQPTTHRGNEMRISMVLALVAAAGLTAGAPARADSNDEQTGPSQPGWNVSSPDRTIQVDVAPRGPGNELRYRVRRGEVVATDWSPLGLRYGDTDFGPDLRVLSAKVEPYADDYHLAHGKASQVSVRANRLTLETASRAGPRMRVVFHAQNDGAAFRYEIPKQKRLPASATVAEEHSGFRIAEGSRAWMQRQALPGSYEAGFAAGPAGVDASDYPRPRGPGWTRDKQALDAWMFPALFATPGEEPTYILLTEASLDGTYTPMRLAGKLRDGAYTLDFPTDDEPPRPEYREGPRLPQVQLPFASPWRVMVIGDLGDIVTTTMVTDLADPLDPMFGGNIPGWIKPGIATWDWYYYRRQRGDEPEGPATGDLARQKRYVDAARDFGWDYVLVDAGWPKWSGPDPYDQLRELASYANERGIGVAVWYHSHRTENPAGKRSTGNVRDRKERLAEFKLLQDLGVKAIKVDFWDGDHQILIQRRIEMLADAARHRLLVNFHGDTLPRGWERRFPNFVTSEAVYGAEAMPTALHDVRLMFTRNVVGPMDYTPVAFTDMLNIRDSSYAHSLAQAVAFYSGMQHFGDAADREDAGYRAVFKQTPAVADLMHDLPAAWDETRFLGGHPDTHIVIARRKGDVWYVAGMNGEEQTRAVTFRPAELGITGNAQLVLAKDGTDRGNNFGVDQRTVGADTPITVDMRFMGGFLARLREP